MLILKEKYKITALKIDDLSKPRSSYVGNLFFFICILPPIRIFNLYNPKENICLIASS